MLYTCINPLPARVSNLNFHPLEVVSRYRDPQLQVAEICLIWNQIADTCSDVQTLISFPIPEIQPAN